MEAISQLTHALTGKERLLDCTEDELLHIVKLYPFFGPAHVLLAKKKKEAKDEDAVDVSARAALFVPNPLWFGELMDEKESDVHAMLDLPHDTVLETPATAEDVIGQGSHVETKESSFAMTEETVLEEPATEEELIEQTSPNTEEIISALPEEALAEEPATEEDVIEQTSPETEEIVSALPEEALIEEPATEEDVIAQLPVEEAEEDEYIDEDDIDQEAEYVPASQESAEDADLSFGPDETGQGDKAPLRPLPSFKIEPIDPAKTELSFEPYYTVDYFASQGIRSKDEEKPRDRLSVQLKSFTEWLKALKTVPATEVASQTTRQEEKKVEQMAKVSVSDREVVTEAMAEVWEKQGNAVKAQELYEKLSLLDPGKSAYFAAKIEHLKQL